jgi:hypothetical protein
MTRSSNSLQPLSPGNIVSASFRLYGANWKSYIRVALVAIGWGVLPLVGLLAIFVLMAVTPFAGILFIPWIALFLYCAAQATLQSGLISRLAFGEFVEKPESVVAGRQALKPKLMQFLVLILLLFLIYLGINIGSTVLQLIPIIGALLSIAASLWFQARLFIPEVALAIENTTDGSSAIGRSWQLSKGSAGPIIITILLATLVSLPFYFVAFLPMLLGLIPLIGQNFSSLDVIERQEALRPFMVALLISVLLFFAISIFTIPFWQTIKSLVYTDLRNRREGFGLELRDRSPEI